MIQEPVDLLIRHAHVVTMDADFQVIPDGAVAIVGDTLMAVGPDAEVAAQYAPRQEIQARGRACLPGLINCHTHIPMTLFRGLADDLELMDWLTRYIFPAEARTVDREFVRCGTRLGAWEMLLGGITTLVDMYYFEEEVAQELSRLGMRAILSQAMVDFPAPDFKSWEATLAGVEAFIHRWRGHPLITPALGPHATYTVSGEHLQEVQRIADRLEVPVVIHLAETRSEEEQVQKERGHRPISYLEHLGVLTQRLIAAHVVWPGEDEIPLLAQRGVGVAHCPHSNTKLAAGIAPVVRLLEAGVPVGLGTDGAASNNDLDMWQEMQTAAFLQKVSVGRPTAMSCRETLALATCGAARAIKMDHLIGSLEPGKRADLLLVRLDRPHQTPLYDVVSQLVYATKATDVERVIINGQTVMENGRVAALDEAQLAEEVRYQMARVRHALETV